jgi:hypothetical protein
LQITESKDEKVCWEMHEMKAEPLSDYQHFLSMAGDGRHLHIELVRGFPVDPR